MEWLLTRLLATVKEDEAIYFVGVLNEYMCRAHPKDYARWVIAGLNDDEARLATDMILHHLQAARAWREVAESTDLRWFLRQLLAALTQNEAIYVVGALNVHMCRTHPEQYRRWVIAGLSDAGTHLLTGMILDHIQATCPRRVGANLTAERKRDVLHQACMN